MFKFCPSCSSQKITFSVNVFRCPDCGLVYYHNTAAANACIITVPDNDGDKLLFTVRGKEPGKGKLDLPGGFIDPGESILEGLYRELREEIGWVPPVPEGKELADVFKLFASFSNIYPYKGFDYNTCDMYFHVHAPGLMPQDLLLAKGEIDEVCFLSPKEIDFSHFAFESTKRAVSAYLNIISL